MFSGQDLRRLLWPLIVEQVLAVLVGMADVLMVSAVGETAVSGVALVDSISLLVIQVLAALATGGSVVCSQYIGRGENQKACKAAGQLVILTLLASSIVMLIALIGNRGLLARIFGQAEEAVLENAETYFWITALSYPCLALYNSSAALFRSMGNSRISMMASFVMNGMNVVGNAICVFGLGMGVEGVAIPTLVSRMFAAGLMMVLLRNPDLSIHLDSRSQFGLESGMIKKILSVGIPSGLENGMFQFGKIFLQSLVSALGTASIAGFAVASNLVTLQYLGGTALGLGLITIVGQCVGAGEKEQAMDYTKKLIKVNYIILFLVCILMGTMTRPIVRLYRLSAEAEEMAVRLIRVHCLAMTVWPLSFTLPNTLRASLDARFTMAVSVCSMWIFRIGFAYLFVRYAQMGVMGIWYGMFIDWMFRALLFCWRFRGFKRRVRQV